MFEWDRNNLRKVRMHRIKREEAEFRSESDEADWWASRAGRDYVKRKSAEARAQGIRVLGSALVAKLNKTKSVQIAIRLPETDLAQAREIAGRKGIGYQPF